jgi:16S rRNA (cytosine1402-N4)-methyltransferase
VETLRARDGGVYCDGTLGGGGHTRALLDASAPSGRVIALDRDPDAVGRAQSQLSAVGDRLDVVHAPFAQVASVLEARGHPRVDGIILDLGVSSFQLDDPERGFSFSSSGPIDMRMDPTDGETALDMIRREPVERLAEILSTLGEERYAKRIAARLKEAARAGELATTADLARIVTDVIPARSQRTIRIHPATRTFQALRIAVNRELDQLEQFLAVFPDCLAAGGRCAIISFHSLEDRMVKHRFRDLAFTSSLPPALARQAGEPIEPVCRVLTKKPITPGDDEVARNPRARSAHMRACEKVA